MKVERVEMGESGESGEQDLATAGMVVLSGTDEASVNQSRRVGTADANAVSMCPTLWGRAMRRGKGMTERSAVVKGEKRRRVRRSCET
jgi:hypothetical protein